MPVLDQDRADAMTGCLAPAKLNLFLHVVGRRSDGYHLLQSVFQLVDLADRLDFAMRDDGVIERISDFSGVAEHDDLCVRAARARYIGVSNFLAYRLARALGRAEAAHLTRFVSVQPRYNLLFRQIERELLPLCAEEGLGVISYNPLAGGLLTGKHKGDAPPPAGRFTLGHAAQMYQSRYWHEREFATIQALEQTVRDADLSLTTASVAWVLANPVITAAILGASRPEQLADTLKAVDVSLSGEVKSKLDELSAEYRMGDAAR